MQTKDDSSPFSSAFVSVQVTDFPVIEIFYLADREKRSSLLQSVVDSAPDRSSMSLSAAGLTGANYGSNGFDIKFVYNLANTYTPPYFATQHGVLGHLLGGWTISPLLTAQSGGGEAATWNEGGLCPGACQAFGESSSSGISSNAEEAVFAAPYTGGTSAHYNVAGSNGIGTNNPTGVNQFADPATVYAEFRPCILGYDTSCGGYYNFRGMPAWNVDATVLKDIGVWKEGRVGATLSFQITNVFNHIVFGGASSLNLSSPATFGRITAAAGATLGTIPNVPRNMEFGLRIHF